jgi:MYXO-CTERM domain-containing protein
MLAMVLPVSLLMGVAATVQARELMTADGPGGVATYTLLGRAYSIEVPDCGHMVPHITEEYDAELAKNVFVFALHVNLDDDRCTATDRQRTEIRGGKLATIVASNGETVYYRWKFKLPVGFQTSPNFTHIFQVKSDAASPVMTLTPRNTTLAIDGVVGERGKTALAPFLGTWVVVDLTVLYGVAGHIDLTIRRIAGGAVLMSYAGDADTWQASDTGHDPKFGLYRSLSSPTYLRDEEVRFADFCVSKVSAAECDDGVAPPRDAGPDAVVAPPPDAGPPPKLDAAVVPADAAVVAADAAVVPPPKLDAPVVLPPPDAAVVPPPKLDAPVVIPPGPDAAVAPPPKLDGPVAIPPADAAVAPPLKLDAAAVSTRPADAAVSAPAPRDAAAVAPPDLAPEGQDPTPPAGGSFTPPGSSGRTRRPGGATGCALASGAPAGPAAVTALVVGVLLGRRRKRR